MTGLLVKRETSQEIDVELVDEASELRDRIRVINTNLKNNLLGKAESGQALLEIKERKLYKTETCSTFEQFVSEEWGGNISARSVNRWIQIYKVFELIKGHFGGSDKNGDFADFVSVDINALLPSVESHIDTLASLPVEAVGAVWSGGVQNEAPPTAEIIRDHIDQWFADNSPIGGLPGKKSKKALKGNTGNPSQKAESAHSAGSAELDADDDNNEEESIVQEIDLIETHETEPDQPKETMKNSRLRIRSLELKKLPKGEPFNLVLVKRKHAKGTISNLLADCGEHLADGGRLAFFGTPDQAVKAIGAIDAGGHNLALEHFIVRAEEPSAEAPDGIIFPIATEIILIITKETKLVKAAPAKPMWGGLTNLWQLAIDDAARVILETFVDAGDRVLCPAGGKDFIAESLEHGCNVVALIDESKSEFYRGMFGGSNA